MHLARVLKRGANVILLDEPTNNLDVNTMRALEDRHRRLSAAADQPNRIRCRHLTRK
jgi:ABC-type cobalamin/Fe3+-siderophores transport system ATPase subunit